MLNWIKISAYMLFHLIITALQIVVVLSIGAGLFTDLINEGNSPITSARLSAIMILIAIVIFIFRARSFYKLFIKPFITKK
jgi:hypothetical protein